MAELATIARTPTKPADDAPHLFLKEQPEGTTGLARRLNPERHYIACRWDYDITSKEMLADRRKLALVRAGNRICLAWPSDWGPHEQETGRAADLSPSLMAALDVYTDDEVEVYYPVTIDVYCSLLRRGFRDDDEVA